jgi:hypothetical protein
MGQYYYVVNLDKKEYLRPHSFNDGAKLCEFGASQGGTMFGLALLLANSNGRGGGDAEENPLIGTWAGDRIVIAGDYGDDTEEYEGKKTNLYSLVISTFKDISPEVFGVVKENWE